MIYSSTRTEIVTKWQIFGQIKIEQTETQIKPNLDSILNSELNIQFRLLKALDLIITI